MAHQTERLTMSRFISQRENDTGDAWSVRDTEAYKYKMPEKAVSMNMTREAAIKVATILNREWAKFLHNPS